MRRNLLLLLIAILMVAAAPMASAGTMALASNGDLYKAWIADDGLTLTRSGADDTTQEWVVPQTQGVSISFIQVVLDEPSNSAYVAWQARADLDASVHLAHLGASGLWSGPYRLAGGHGDGVGALHPVVLYHQVSDQFVDDDGHTQSLETTFLHMTWWQKSYYAEHGIGVLQSIPLDASGTPMVDVQAPVELGDLLNYGISCSNMPNADMLTYPRAFLDLETNSPHIVVTDFATCLLPMIELGYDIEEVFDGIEKRRRHITVFRNETMLAIPPSVPLGQAKLEVGRSLTAAFHWDVDEGVAWVLMDRTGWSEAKVLTTGDDLSHEQAVGLIRKLIQ